MYQKVTTSLKVFYMYQVHIHKIGLYIMFSRTFT